MESFLDQLELSGTARILAHGGGIIILTILAAIIMRMLLYVVGTRITKHTKSDLDDQLLLATRKYIYYLTFLVGFVVLGNYCERVMTTEVEEGAFKILDGISYSLGVLIVAALLVRILTITFRHYATTSSRHGGAALEEFVPLVHRVTSIVLYIVAAVTILEHFGVDVKALIAVLGVGSLAIALAAQDTLANMIGGFVLMVDRPIRVGDWIRLTDGTATTVHEIGLRSTKLKTLDNTLIIVPNAEMVKSSIHNLSYPELDTGIKVEVSIAYDSDITKVRSILLEEATNHPRVMKDPPPAFRFSDFGESALRVRVLCQIAHFTDRFIVESDLRSAILERFKAEGIEMPYPQLVIHQPQIPNQAKK